MIIGGNALLADSVMAAQTDLKTLISSMNPVLQPDEFVFCSTRSPTELADLQPLLTFHENEGTTVIVRKKDIAGRGVPFQYPCRQITLTVHSSLALAARIAVGIVTIVPVSVVRDSITTIIAFTGYSSVRASAV